MIGMRGEVYLAQGDLTSLEIMILKDFTDMETAFLARCMCEGDVIAVHGSSFSFELVEAGGDCPLVLEAA